MNRGASGLDAWASKRRCAHAADHGRNKGRKSRMSPFPNDSQVNAAPRRRRFQFRLSTWLLVAILAWAISTRPYQVPANLSQMVFTGGGFVQPSLFCRVFGFELMATRTIEYVGPTKLNPTHLYPALALAAFIGWKAAWLIVDAGIQIVEQHIDKKGDILLFHARKSRMSPF